MSWYRRLGNLMRSERLTRNIDREMAFHIAELTDELVAAGMNEHDARREALRRFGHRGDVKERVRRVDVLHWMESLVVDIQYAFRGLKKSPGFTAIAVLSLGLGIGANTAIFSLINAVMLRSLPISHPEELVQIVMDEGRMSFTNPLWEQIQERQGSLSGTLAFSEIRPNLTRGGAVRRADGAFVSGGYFNTLGIRPFAGRVIVPTDDVRGCRGIVVLSHSFWQREYGGDVNAVGRTITLDGRPFEIIGVTAAGFSGIHVGRDAEVFTPICSADILREGREILDARSTWFLYVFGRLPPSGTLTEVQNDLASVSRGVYEATVPPRWTVEEQREYMDGTLSARPAINGVSRVRGQYGEALVALFVVVGIVLLIACANVAQLLLARATARMHETSVRLALGSGAMRLVRQLLTESILLALLGAAVGVIFARWSTGLVVSLLSQNGRSVALDLSIDMRVLGFAVAVATATGVLFAIGPALRSARISPQTALRASGRGLLGDGKQRFAKGIVVGQVALSLVLVMAAGLLVGSFQRLATIDPGFQQDGVLLSYVSWAGLGFEDERGRTMPRKLVERIRSLPGVRQASASLLVPIGGSAWNEYVVADGFEPESERDALVWFNAVSDGFLETLGTDLLAGRDFTTQDRQGAPSVVLVNETLARRYYGGASPLGKQIRTNNHDDLGPPMEIVGVVEDAKYRQVDEEILPTAYAPLDQAELWGAGVELAVRTDGSPQALIASVTRAVQEVHPAISLEFNTLADQIGASLARPRLLATLSGFFGLLALLLAVIGLYGTISYNVARRRGEIGIRIALGAARYGMLRMVAGEAGGIVGIGVILGAALALITTRLVGAFLYGVTPTDPVTLMLSALLLAVVAMVAGMVPAWRAAAVDPMVTLRED